MEECKKALSEVYAILRAMPQELTDKIPDKFKETVENERDKNYQPNVDELIFKDSMLPETKVILAMIYRDYLSNKN